MSGKSLSPSDTRTKRRALLGVAGCLTGYRGASAGETGAALGERAPGTPDTVAESGIPATVREEPPDLLAIDDPAFAADWSGVDPARRYRLENDHPGLPGGAVVIGLLPGATPGSTRSRCRGARKH